MKNKIEDLRNHLFEVIEMLKDGDKRMDIEKAKVIGDVAQTIINSAKVEVDFIRHTGGEKADTGFLSNDVPRIEAVPGPADPARQVATVAPCRPGVYRGRA